MELYIIWIIVAVIIAAAGFIFGQERRYRKGDYFLPPFDISPAEAAVFVDDTIYIEEIIGVIFTWASKGIIVIEEIDNPVSDIDKIYDSFIHSHDYILTKKQNIPDTAPEYEKFLFEKIFKDGAEHCATRELKGEIYLQTETAIKKMKEYIDNSGYYRGKTRETGEDIKENGMKMVSLFKNFTKVRIYILILLIVTGLIIPYLLLMWTVITVGKIIPMKNREYREQFTKAKHFQRFIRKSKKEEIEGFILNDNKYFEKTLPYAAAMGMGWDWTYKCIDYIESPPEWYKGYGEYSKADFLNFMDKSYYVLKKVLLAKPSQIDSASSVKRYRK